MPVAAARLGIIPWRSAAIFEAGAGTPELGRGAARIAADPHGRDFRQAWGKAKIAFGCMRRSLRCCLDHRHRQEGVVPPAGEQAMPTPVDEIGVSEGGVVAQLVTLD